MVIDDVLALREQIPTLRKTLYLNSGWSGPSPQRVIDRVIERLRWENDEGPTAPQVLERFWRLHDEVRDGVAATFGAQPDEIVTTANTTEGINLVLNGLPWSPGDNVVTYNFEHHSVLVPLYHLRERKGVDVRFARLDVNDSPETIVAKFEAAMTATTRLLVVSHISYSTGLRLPLEAICAMAHARGAQVLADGAQTAGQIVLQLAASGADYYAFTGHKWLLGPEGAGALFVRRERLPALQPTAVSIHAAEHFDYEGAYTPKRDTPEKFQLTTVNGALFQGFLEAMALYREIGPAAIEARTRRLGQLLAAKLAAIPGVALVSPTRQETASGLVSFRVGDRRPREVVDMLWERRRIVVRAVDYPAAIRASCHYFNTEEDLDALVAEIVALA
ncbi:MAG: aminotransferase class V-fold PLP-dependent enzyme [Dehalococcoidia bacterium]|nr:aminotransferase class V-fold PLP-dependent enzyme [Dehalococcoidia bacterium]